MTQEVMTAIDDSQTVKPDELARILDVGRNTIYEGLRSGKIPAIRLGKRFVIPRAAITEWLKTAGQAS